MAVRVNPGAGQPVATPGKGAGQAVPGKAAEVLQQLGIVKPGMSAQQITQNLVRALSARGFGGGDILGLGPQLSAALAAFQKANGLPVTGNLDAATVALLQKMGLLAKNPRASAGVVNVKDGFEGAAKAQQAQADAKGAQAQRGDAAQQTPQQFLAGIVKAAAEGSQKAMEFLLGMIGLGGGAGAAADGSAAAPPAGAAAGDAGAAANAAASAGARADGDAQARIDGSGLGREVAGDSKKLGDEKARAKKGLKDAKERGLEEDEGEDEEGDGEEGERGSSKGEGQGGGAEDGAHDKGSEDGDDDGSERWQGSATSGDADRDREQGHAQLPEDWQDKPGYYKVPPVSSQWRRALSEIQRDEDGGRSKATTYTWDVVFYSPGVYGPGQKAEELLHLVVQEATAFDRAWARAVESLEGVVRELEGENADMPIKEDVLAAIRQARVRG